MKRPIIVLVHLAIGLLLYAIIFFLSDFFLRLSRPEFGTIPGHISYILAMYVLLVVAFPFYSFYFLFPKLTATDHRLYWWLAALCLLMIMPVLFLQLDNQRLSPGNYAASFLFLLLFSVLGALFRSFFEWLEQDHLRASLEQQQLVSELAMLRLQLNPHFLFNTLHNIDALINRQPDTASRLLIRLSTMMRYMLYESQENKVLLKQEIQYIEDYIALQNLRCAEEDSIKFTLKGDPGSISVAPMLLLPFIENAFKHHKKRQAADVIDIELAISHQQVFFHCTNSCQPREKAKAETQGIGLRTIQRRLALIYPGKHALSVEIKNHVFDVRLRVDTNEN